jgi:hypothetical protein
MDNEEILINLKVLHSLQKNQKLISRGQFINIEPLSIIPEAIRRWQRQDSRNETLNKINLIVNSALTFINKNQVIKGIKDKKYNIGSFDAADEDVNNEDHSDGENDDDDVYNMKLYLKDSLKGIINLKETYSICTQTCARLDVIINKIETALYLKKI